MVELLKAHGFRVFGRSKVHRYFYSLPFRGFPVLVGLDSNRPLDFHKADLLQTFPFSYGCTLRGPPVFVWLDS